MKNTLLLIVFLCSCIVLIIISQKDFDINEIGLNKLLFWKNSLKGKKLYKIDYTIKEDVTELGYFGVCALGEIEYHFINEEIVEVTPKAFYSTMEVPENLRGYMRDILFDAINKAINEGLNLDTNSIKTKKYNYYYKDNKLNVIGLNDTIVTLVELKDLYSGNNGDVYFKNSLLKMTNKDKEERIKMLIGNKVLKLSISKLVSSETLPENVTSKSISNSILE
ncbi:hypothetical protein [Telluribacter sp. SYSU D00476]|uniref:hypothetical protein n=1 Tax=Telluribacter sp. SYSU D00476 TaxID=2811430 RepID=UPI001FF3F0EE|nr:hypothetical protein [Telluribacter sp. SYSU D00476]